VLIDLSVRWMRRLRRTGSPAQRSRTAIPG